MILRWKDLGCHLGRNLLWLPFSPSVHSGPSSEGCLFSHHLPMLGSLAIHAGCPRWPHEVFFMSHERHKKSLSVETPWGSGTSEERAGRGLEAGSWWEETNCQLEGKLPPEEKSLYGPCVVLKLASSWPPPYPCEAEYGVWGQKAWGPHTAFCTRCAALSKPWNHLLLSSLNVI